MCAPTRAVPDLTAAMLPGPYRVPAYRAIGHVRLTNKTPGGTYRAPGRYESTFVRERLMDAIAAQLGIDRIEVRRRNLIDKAEMPYARPLDDARHRGRLDSGDYAGLLDKALAAIEWTRCRRSCGAAARPANASAPGLRCSSRRAGSARSTACASSVDPAALVEVVTGAASVGQGVETVMAQICADALGVDYAASASCTGRPTASPSASAPSPRASP